MSEWHEVTLEKLGRVERGRSRHRPRNDPRLFGGDMPFFQTGDVKAATLHMTKVSQTYSDFGVSQSRVWPAGITCITIAANIADTAVLACRGCFPDSVLGFTPTESTDAYFVKYLLDVYRDELASKARGTTQGNLSLEKLLTHSFRVPDLPARNRIASILRSMDELIENNWRRIELLERMARGIYREWFVHFRFPGHRYVAYVDSRFGPIPEGWQVSQLRDVAAVNRAARKPTPGERIRYLDISCLGDHSIENLDPMDGADAPGRARRVVSAGDIAWSMVRPNRRSHALLVQPGVDWIASTGLAIITPKSISASLLFETVSSPAFSDYLVSRAAGSAYPAVKPRDFEDAPILVPPMWLDRRFSEVAETLHQATWLLREQLVRLSGFRDLLLPKLVTGQTDVSTLDVNAVVDSVA